MDTRKPFVFQALSEGGDASRPWGECEPAPTSSSLHGLQERACLVFCLTWPLSKNGNIAVRPTPDLGAMVFLLNSPLPADRDAQTEATCRSGSESRPAEHLGGTPTFTQSCDSSPYRCTGNPGIKRCLWGGCLGTSPTPVRDLIAPQDQHEVGGTTHACSCPPKLDQSYQELYHCR